MKNLEVTMVRVYLTEGESKLNPLLKRLHDWEKVRGVTVFRGISGFGGSGTMHSSALLDISLDLPIVIEFFDAPDKIDIILSHLATMVDPGHIVHWRAQLLVNDGGEPESAA
jgi:PII-like signaling protein